MKQIFFLPLWCLLALRGPDSLAQTTISFDSPRWTIKADSAIREEYQGHSSLKLINGTAVLGDAHFTNGIIEFNIFLEQGRYFPGMRFRIQDALNGESYYLRPHQSGNPDAMQYYPEYNGAGSWQLYYGTGFNNAHRLPFDRWLHIKMLISGSRAEVYFDQEKDPVLYIHKLKRPLQEGMISLENEWSVPVHYADFMYTAMDTVALMSRPEPDPVLPTKVFKNWEVSAPFDEKLVEDKLSLTPSDRSALTWKTLPADERGIADLSILAGAMPGKNTVFVRQVIESDRPQIKKLSFGFSDRVRVYLNAALLYAGEDDFLSRDYRFLGTMGYFDMLYLNLKKGRNEIWMAVSEDMGGWGIQAKLEDIR